MSVAVAVFLLLVLFWPLALGLSFTLADSAVLLKDLMEGERGE